MGSVRLPLFGLLSLGLAAASPTHAHACLREKLLGLSLEAEDWGLTLREELLTSLKMQNVPADEVDTFIQTLDSMGLWKDRALQAELLEVLGISNTATNNGATFLIWQMNRLVTRGMTADQGRRLLSNFARVHRVPDLPMTQGIDGFMKDRALQSYVYRRLKKRFPESSDHHLGHFFSYLLESEDEIVARQILYQLENVWPENVARNFIRSAAEDHVGMLMRPADSGAAGIRVLLLRELNASAEYRRLEKDLILVHNPPTPETVEASIRILSMPREDQILIPPFTSNIRQRAITALVLTDSADQRIIPLLEQVVANGPFSYAVGGDPALALAAELALERVGHLTDLKILNEVGFMNLKDTIAKLAPVKAWDMEHMKPFLDQFRSRLDTGAIDSVLAEVFVGDLKSAPDPERILTALRLIRESKAKGSPDTLKRVRALSLLAEGEVGRKAKLTLDSMLRRAAEVSP